ncbi:MAG: phosphate-starvation-inducible PsiE family protein [Ferruginibacter sp.]
MPEDKNAFNKGLLTVNKLIIKFLLIVLTVCLLLASADLVYLIYLKLKEPPFWLVDVTTLFDVFSLVLIIAIGYELVKSLILIISSESIPSFPIVQIAIIAVANKIITLDIKHTDQITIYGLAILMAALGVTYHFHRQKGKAKQEDNPPNAS